VPCAPEQVIVVAGAQAALDLACRLLADAGDAAWIEDPGYAGARGAMAAAGLRIVPVPVDAEGLDVAAGARRAPDARLVHVTPSHQFPLGVTMSLARRLALIEWAEHAGAWVLEDDYDSEYRYAGRPLAAMAGLAPGRRVIHVGTFSKTMFAGLRAGWLVVPPPLVGAFEHAVRQTGHTVPSLVQGALADFIVDGHFAAHLRSMRVLYAARQERLLRAIARRLPDGGLDAVRTESGLQLPAWLPAGTDDVALARDAFTAGVVVAPLSAYAANGRGRPGLALGYAGVPEREIDAGVARLAPLVARVGRRC
jgi:GntR family transcriptional regulator/MocR family aminotransferase